MSGRDERKLVDVRGRYRYVARDGQRVAEDAWRECRLVVTTRRVAVGTDDGTRSVSHEDIAVLDADALPSDVDADGGTPVRFGDAVLLVDAGDDVDLERATHRGVVEGAVVLVRPRAVVDGEERGDAGWHKARVGLSEGRLTVSVQEGDSFAFDADAVASVATRAATVAGEDRTLVAVGYDDGTPVETHFSGTERSTDALAGLFRSLADAAGSGTASSAAASGGGAEDSGSGAADADGATESDAAGATGGDESATADDRGQATAQHGGEADEGTDAGDATDAGDVTEAGDATEAGDVTEAGDAAGAGDPADASEPTDDADEAADDGDDGEFTPEDLSETDRRILVALYSGVSPFEMSDLVGMDVDDVEATYQRLLRAGVVDEVRTRTEVAINGTGRNVASEAMSEE